MEIYTINQELQKALLIENEEERNYLIDQLNLNLQEKLEQLTMAMKNYETRANGLKAEAERLAGLAVEAQNRALAIKNAIKGGMDKQGLKRLEFSNFELLIKKNPPRVKITSEIDIPADYWVTKEVHSINKKMLSEKLKSGEVISGAELEQDTSLKIK
jgi:hypothetical protein